MLAIAGPGRDRVATRLPAGVIAETFGDALVAVLPDPDGPGARAAVQRAVADAGVTAGLGATVDGETPR